MKDTKPLLFPTDFPALKRGVLETLQVNLGYLCNQRCLHCHVNAGPTRTEIMSREVIDLVLEVAERLGVKQLDLTGGAPEMNPHFKTLVTGARELGVEVIDRCNLTVLVEPGYEELAEFLAANDVQVTASLPCYLQDNVDAQRGDGVFQKSIEALIRLNELGYAKGSGRGTAKGGLQLNLVYNPQGPQLPPPQQELESQYKAALFERYGIVFDQLLTITNMPISRFGSTLVSRGEFSDYLALLKNNYHADNLSTVMCRSIVSVDWQGYLYDCDFNQMLGMPLFISNKLASDKQQTHLSELLEAELSGNAIAVGEHCYGCTAGQGSSCSGALATG